MIVVWVTLATAIVILITSALNLIRATGNKNKIIEVHALVNDRLERALSKIRELEKVIDNGDGNNG